MNIKRIRVEQGLINNNKSRESYVSVEGGKLISVHGLAGITQFEDEVVFPIVNYTAFKLPQFIWMHYFSIVLEVECLESTKLVFKDKNDKTEVDLESLSSAPLDIKVNEKNSFQVYLHDAVKTGHAKITPEKVCTGHRQAFKITYEAGENGLDIGGGIRILSPYSNWSEPYLDSDMHIDVISSNDAKVEVKLTEYPTTNRGYVYSIKVVEGRMKRGDKIVLQYTDKTGEGVRVQPYTQENMYLLCWEDSKGNGAFYPVPLNSCPKVSIVAGKPERFRIKVQQVLEANKAFDIQLRVLDKMLNPVEGWNGFATLKVADREGKQVFSRILNFKDSTCKISSPGLEDGLYVVSITAEGFTGESIVINSKTGTIDEHLYYGQIHGHSEVSDGAFGQEGYFKYGRDMGMLDFCALSDHDWEIVEHPRNIKNNRLEALGKITERLYRKGEYVTICGYEWMGDGGHLNVYYLSDLNNPVYVGKVRLLDLEKLYPTMKELLDEYKGRDDVLIIPHFSHGFEWKYYDRELQPVAEIYSQWGYSEVTSVSARKVGGAIPLLAEGKKFGFISGADSHHGRPGQTGYYSKYKVLNHREGLACVYASKLNRKELFNSIKQRHTYATTGERIMVGFSINAVHMGGEITLDKTIDVLDVHCLIGATRNIKTIEIISGGEVVYGVNGTGGLIQELRIQLPRRKQQNEYYYVRVKQEDGEMAWSSPIWVEYF